VFKNRVLRRIFGPKREEVVGGWRSMHNEELHNLYASSNNIMVVKSRLMMGSTCRMRMGGGETKNVGQKT
jgi:hypothetical protein